MSSLKTKVKNYIYHEIHSGGFPINEYLPPPETICKEVDCSVETVRVAIRELAASGILKSNKRWGTMVQKLPPMGKVCLLPAKDTHINYLLQETIYIALIEAGFDVETQLPVFENQHVFGTLMRIQNGLSPADSLVAICPEHYDRSDGSRFMQFLSTFDFALAYKLDQPDSNQDGMISVSTDPYVASRLVAEHFLEKGHKKIAAHAGINESNFSSTTITSQCFKQMVEMQGAECYLHRMAEGKKHLLDLIKNQGVTAYWALNDHSAREDISFLAENKLRVPEDIAVVGKHNTPWSTQGLPQLSSVSLNPRQVADKIVESIRNFVQTGKRQTSKILIEPQLVIRDSG